MTEISWSISTFLTGKLRLSTRRLGVTIAVAVVLGGCSQSPSIPATVNGPSYASVVSGVLCAPQGRSVLVTGTLTGVANVPAYSGVSATVYDSSKKQIGSADGPIIVVNDGQSVPISMTVDVTGTPASCFVTWGAGPPPPSPG